MLQLSWQSLWARRRRLASTAISVVLGVAFLVGTIVLGDTIAANFDDLFTETAAGTDVVVRGESPLESSFEADPGRRPIDESLVEQVAAIDGVDVAEAQVLGYGQLLGADGDPIGGNGPPRLAGNWITTSELNAYQLAEGRAPEAPDEVVINRGAADSGGLALGDRTVVQVPAPLEVTVVGISTFGDADGFGETTMTAFTFDAAQQHVMRQPGTVGSIVVNAADGQDAEQLRAELAQLLPGGVEAVTGDEITQERLDSLDFLSTIRTFLVAFAVIALFVAGLSINNTFSITVAQRTRELALLRSIGASRKQLRRMVTFEALTVGAIGSIVGVLVGVGVGALLKGVFAGFGLALPTGGLTVERPPVVIGSTVGILATLLAARAPARRAARVAPIEALQASAGDGPPIRPGRLILAIAVLLIGGGLSVIGAGGAVALVGIGALLLVTASLMIAPIILPAFARVVGMALRRTHGVNGDLAEQNARRQPRRAARTATALLIGVAVVAIFTVLTASMAATVEGDASTGFGNADLAITTPVFGGGTLSPEVLTDLEGVAEIDEAVAVAAATVVIGGEETQVVATDLTAARSVLDTSVRDGSLDDLGRAAVSDTARRYAGDVQDRAEFVEASAAGLDLLLGIVYVMLAFAILISLLGITNTLSMAVHERRHEIGLLRAVGQTRRQTRSVLRLESLIVAAFGTALGLLLGTILGVVLYLAISDGDGAVTVPWTSLVVVLIVGVVAGMLAAWRPARRAARLDILDAIATA